MYAIFHHTAFRAIQSEVDEIYTVFHPCVIEIGKLLIARSMSTCSLVIDGYYTLSQITVINFLAWSSPKFASKPLRTKYARNAALTWLLWLTYSNLKKRTLPSACMCSESLPTKWLNAPAWACGEGSIWLDTHTKHKRNVFSRTRVCD